jgi:hypothetical protein
VSSTLHFTAREDADLPDRQDADIRAAWNHRRAPPGERLFHSGRIRENTCESSEVIPHHPSARQERAALYYHY